MDTQKLKELKTEKASLAGNMLKIVELAENEKRGLTTEERTQWDGMRNNLDSLDERIKGLEEAIELSRSLAEPINPLPAETRHYDDLGFPIQGNALSVDERQNEEQNYLNAFMALMRSDQPGMIELSEEQRSVLRSNLIVDKRAQGTVPTSSGGFLVPVILSNRIVEVMQAYGGIRRYATVINTGSGETMNYPTNDDTGNEGELVGEHEQAAEGDLIYGQKAIGAYKYSSKVIRVSIELLQDSAFALDAFITRKFGQRLGRITARHYATGTGSEQPTGLVTAADVGYTAASATIIEYNDLLRLKHSVDPAYREMGNCRWVMNDKTLLQLKEMVDANKRPLWKPSIADGTPALIDGDPYVVDQGVEAPSAGAVSMAYGDLSEFTIRDVMGFTMHRMVEKYIDYGQIGFLAFMRTDSNLMDSKAVKTLKMSGSKAKAPEKS